MSIINGMHKDLGESGQVQPVLSTLPNSKTKQKVMLLSAIAFLVICSLILIGMIFLTENSDKNPSVVRASINENLKAPIVFVSETSAEEVNVNQQNTPILKAENQPLATIESSTNVRSSGQAENVTTIEVITEPTVKSQSNTAIKPATMKSTAKNKVAKQSAVKPETKPKSKPKVTAQKTTTPKPQVEPKTALKSNQSFPPSELEPGHLNIESAQLSDMQIANIYLKEASKAQAKGDNYIAAEKWQKALNVKPDLNEVRKTLAMYHYSQDEEDKTTRLLKKGALISPEYSDFNLMLSRIALKNNDQQKAFLYLEQNPPNIEGNIDYYISHAILAQKFKMYERSEELYKSLLTQRPNNGRWLMSLAIAQDRQRKTPEAIGSYQKALKQTDLSTKAKAYINKRLAFLNKE